MRKDNVKQILRNLNKMVGLQNLPLKTVFNEIKNIELANKNKDRGWKYESKFYILNNNVWHHYVAVSSVKDEARYIIRTL